jgi:hypothetical protein
MGKKDKPTKKMKKEEEPEEEPEDDESEEVSPACVPPLPLPGPQGPPPPARTHRGFEQGARTDELGGSTIRAGGSGPWIVDRGVMRQFVLHPGDRGSWTGVGARVFSGWEVKSAVSCRR